MKKITLLVLFISLVASKSLFSQAASWDYVLTTEASSPISISGGTLIPGTVGLDDNAKSLTYPFSFRVYDKLYQGGVDKYTIASNGFINFGSTNPGLSGSDYYIDGIPLAGTGSTPSHVWGSFFSYGGYGDGKISDSAATIVTGTAPYRILTIAFMGYKTFYSAADNHKADIRINFHETTNIISVDYTNITGTPGTTGGVTRGNIIGINANTNGVYGTLAGNFPTAPIRYVYTPYFPEPDTLIASKNVSLPSQKIDLSFIRNSTNDDVIITYNTTNNFTAPIAGTTYSVGDEISNNHDSVFYIGGASPRYHTGLAPNTIYYYRAWSVRANGVYSPYYKYDSAKTGIVNPPVSFTATPSSQEQVNLAWAKNAVGNDVIITWNSTNTFADPTANPSTYNIGDEIVAGQGKVLYKGPLTSKVVNSLIPNTQYFYKIWSYNSLGYYSTGITANATTQNVADPANFSVASASSCKNNISWNKNAFNNDVIVLFNTTGVFTAPTNGSTYNVNDMIGAGEVLSVTGTTYSHADLSENTHYYYKAYSFDANHVYSNGVADDITTPVVPDVTAFSTNAVSAYSISGSWTANSQSDNVIVVWSTNSTIGTPVDGSTYANGGNIPGGGKVLTQGAITSFSHNGLNPNTTIYYKVFSYDCKITYSAGSTANQTTTSISNPTAFTATASSSCKIDVSWTLAGGNDVLLLRNSSNSFGTPVAGTSYTVGQTIGTATVISVGNATSKSEFPLDNGITRYYKAFSIDGLHNYSLGTTVKNATTPDVVNPTMAASSSTLNSITINWALNAASDDVIILWNTINTFGSLTDGNIYNTNDVIAGGGTVLDKGNITTKIHSGLTTGTTYFYKVYSIDCNTNYSAGAAVSETTGSLSNPTAFAATASSSCKIDVSWNLSGGNDVLVLSNSSNSFGSPNDGTSYTIGQSIGASTVYYVGSATAQSDFPLDNGTTRYYKAFSFDGSHTYSSGTSVKSAITPDVVNPVMAASSSTLTSITINWALNAASDDVIILWSTSSTFGPLSDGATYNNGDVIAGGGTVLDQGNLTTKTHSGLTTSTTYYYKVYSYDCNKNYSSGATDSETTASLSNPTALTATAVSSCKIDVSWNLSGGNDALVLSNSNNSFGTPNPGTSYTVGQTIGTATVISVGSATSKSESPLDNGALRYYKAFSFDGSHNYSNGTSVEIEITPNVSNPVMAASSSTLTSITINWTQNAASDDVIILWNTTSTFGSLTDATTYNNGDAIAGGGTVLDQGNLTTKIHSGLSTSTTYYYKVYSYDCNKNYSSGVADSETTGSVANPTALSANASSSCKIDVSWALTGGNDVLVLSNTANSFGTPNAGTSYTVGQTIGTAEVISVGSATAKSEFPLDNGITKYYKAFSFDGSHNYSSGTAVKNATTPDVVNPTMAASSSTLNSITLNWSQNAASDEVIILWNTTNTFGPLTDATVYNINDVIAGGGTVLDKGNLTTKTHSGLSASTTYYYKVYSYDCNTNYSSGATDSETTSSIANPTALTATAASSCKIDISWVLSAGNDVLVLSSNSNSFGTPVDGTTYAVGSALGAATVISSGSATSKDEAPLDNGITKYYKAFSYDATFIYSIGTAVESATTPDVVNPVMAASSSTLTSITLNWAQNAASDDVIILWNTTNTFGPLTDATVYNINDVIAGGGTVLDKGNLTTKTHTGLNSATTYYYKVYSYDCNTNYSSGATDSETTTSLANPTALNASAASSCKIDVSWALAGGNDVLVLSSTTNSFGTPTPGTSYTVGQPLGAATVFSVGNATAKSEFPLDNSITKYYKAFSFDASHNYSSGTAVKNATTPDVVNPTMAAASSTLSSITLNWAQNATSDDVIILWNTTNTFGALTDGTVYNTNDVIAGGGTVLDKGNLTTTTHSGLTASTTYYYKVYSFDCNTNYSSGSASSETTASILNPTNLVATAASSCAINVSWTLVGGNDALVLANTSNSFGTPTDGTSYSIGQSIGTATVLSSGSGTSKIHDPLDKNTTYYYKAFSFDGSHNYSVGTAVENATTSDVIDPVMAASSSTLNTITINWALNAASDNVIILWNTTNTFGPLTDATVYNINDVIAGGGTVLDKGNITTKNHTGLSASTTYYYKVYSFDCNTNYSSGVESNETTTASTVVADPLAFTAVMAGPTSIDLAWTKNAVPNDVIIVRNTTNTFTNPWPGAPYFQGGTIGTDVVVYKGSATTFNDDDAGAGLSAGVTYYYKAYSFNTSNYYSPGILANATITNINDPAVFSSTAITYERIDLAWTSNASGDSVMITYNTVNQFAQPTDGTVYPVGNQVSPGQGKVLYRGLGSTVTAFQHIGLNPSTTYYYKIWCYDNSSNYYSNPGLTDNATTMAPGIAILPHFTDFETETGTTGTPVCGSIHNLNSDWHNVLGDDMDWTPRSGGTNSTGTGPDHDNTTGTGKYIYTEATSCFNKTAWLVSPLYNFSGLTNPRIEFYYHMYGANMGTVSVQASTDGGTTWSSNLFTKSGQQHASNGAAYTKADVNLVAYAGMSNIRLRITGLTGFSFRSDIAIDDIRVYQPQNMAITSVIVEQDNDPVVLGEINQEVIRVKVVTYGAFSPLTLTQLNFGTSGTTLLSDIQNAKVFYTGSSPNFNGSQQIGSTTVAPGASFQISGSKLLQEGVNYFWLTYDIPSSSTISNFVDASCSQVTIAGTNHTPSITSPPAVKKIIGRITIEGTVAAASQGPVFRPNVSGAYEMIYLASELGASAKELTKIEFYKASGNNITNNIDPISIYMKNASGSTLASGAYSTTGYTLVYTGQMPNNIINGWIGVDLDNVFLYDGTNNVHILVTQPKMTTNWGNYPAYSHHSTGASMRKRSNSLWNGTVTNLNASSARANVRLQYELPQPMVYVSSTTSHPDLSNLGVGANGEQIIMVDVVTQYTGSPLSLSKLNFKTNGTTLATDISNAKVYYTGSSVVFATTNQFGSTISNPNGNYSATGTQTLGAGHNYFWVTYDISATAVVNNVVDAECESIIVSSITKTPTITAPAGNRKIKDYIIIGTATTSSYDQPLSDYYYHKWEGIYLASELGAAKDLSALAFYKASGSNVINDILNVTIYMKHTTANSLSTGSASSAGYTQVFTGSFPNDATSGWMEVSLSAPFAYNGTDNVEIYIEQNRGSWYNQPPYWAYTTTTNNRARYAENWSAMPNSLPATNKLANIRLEFSSPSQMTFVSSTTVQNNFTNITSGVIDQEIIGMELVMTNSANPLSATSFTFSTNGSSSPITDISNAKVFYTNTNNTFATTTQFGSVVANPNGTFTVTGNQALTMGTNYFWLTYDIPASATNGNWVDAQCTSIKVGGVDHVPTVTDPIGNRTIQSALSGYYTIGTTGDYATFTDAVTALNTLGVSGWVTFQVQDGTYNEKLNLTAVANASAANVITFEALSGDSTDVILQYSTNLWNDAATVKFSDANHFIFQKMTIKGNGASYAHAVEISAANTGNNVVRNCVLQVTPTTISQYSAVVYSYNAGASNTRIVNNKINTTGYPIYVYGNWSNNASGWEVDSNIIISNTYGTYFYYCEDMKVRSNIISSNAGSTNFRGIYINNSDGPFDISSNKIESKGSNISYGIYSNNSTGTTANPISIYNNFIANTINSSTTVGIGMQGSSYLNIYFNNINITSTSGTSRAAISATTGSNIKLRNNNLIASGGGYAILYSNSTNSSSDYNNMYTTGTTLASFNGSLKANLAAWQASTSGDANSLSVDPSYTSSVDLHIANVALNNVATPIVGITVDIDGDARHATTPDIGADELGSDLDAGVLAITDPVSPLCSAGNNDVKVDVKNYGGTTLTSLTINWKVNGTLQAPIAWTGSLVQNATVSVTLASVNFVLGNTSIIAWTSAPNGGSDQYPSNDSANASIDVSATPTVNVGNDTSICASSYTTINTVASGYSTLLWTTSGSGSFNSGSALVDVYNPSAADYTAGSVYLKLTASSSCGVEDDSLLLTISQPPTVSFSGNAAQYCANDPVDTLVGSPLGGVFSGPGMSGQYFTPANANIGNNLIKYVYINGVCKDSATQTIVVNSVPVVNLSGINAAYCDNDGTVSLTGTPAGGAFGGLGVVGNIFDPSNAGLPSPTKVWYSYSNGSCNAADTQNVVINPAPIADAGSDKNIFILTNTTLDGSASGGTGSYSYSWTPTNRIASGANAAVATTNNLFSSQVFNLLVTDNGNSCTSTDNMTVTVGNPFVMNVTVTATPDTICLGDSIHLESTVNGGTGPYVYSWISIPAGYTSSDNNPWIHPTQNAYYKLVVNDNGSLSDEDSVWIVVNPIPNTSFTGLPATICSNGNSVNLVGSPAGGTFSGSGVIGSTFTPSSVGAGSYDVIYSATNSFGCTNSDTNSIVVDDAPLAFAGNDASITSGTSTTINGSASGGTGSYSYSWTPIADIASGVNSASATTNNLVVATLFTLSVTDNGNSCSDNDDVLISVGSSTLAANITATEDTICNGANTQLTVTAAGGSGTYTYSWTSIPAGFTSSIVNPTVNPIVNTDYTVVVDDGISTVNKTITIVVSDNPIVNAGSDQSIPTGTSTTLTGTVSGGSSPYTYAWTPSSDIASGANTLTPTTNNITALTTYTLTVVDDNNCTANDAVNVDIQTNALAVSATANPTAICDGSSTSITALASGGSGTYTYSWTSVPVGFTATGAVVSASPTVNTTYTVVVNDGVTTANNTVSIVVNSNPTANAGSDQSIATGTSTTLSGSAIGGNGAYSYSWIPVADIASGATTATPTTNNLNSSVIYVLTVTDGNGCTDNDDMNVLVGNALAATATATPDAICNGNSTQLNVAAAGGSGTYTYTWSSTPVGFVSAISNPTASPSVNTTYTVIVNDGVNTISKTVSVTVNNNPVADAGTDQTITTGTSANLTGSASMGSGSYSYSWTPIAKLVNASMQNPTTTLLSSNTTYSLLVTDNVSGCTGTDDVDILMANSVVVTATATPSTICEGESTQLLATASSGSGTYTYSWSSTPVGFSSTLSNPTASPTTTTTYTVAVDDGINTISNTVVVTVNPKPNASFTGLASDYCNGDAVALLVGSPAGGTFNGPGITGNQFDPTNANIGLNQIIYNVTQNTCTDADTQFVDVHATPIANAGSDFSIPWGVSTSITGSYTGGSDVGYFWTPLASIASGANSSMAVTVILNVTTQFTLETKDTVNGCSSTDDVIVNVLSPSDVIVTANATPDTICNGDNTQLQALATGTPPYNYAWSSVPTGFVSTLSNPIASPTITTTYRVIVIDALTTTDTAWVTVVVNPTPIASMLGLSSSYCDNSTSVSLLGTPAGGIFSGPGITGSIFDPANANIGNNQIIYSVSQNGCSDADTQFVAVAQTPIANAGSDITMIAGDTVLDGSYVGGNDVGYFWTPSSMLLQDDIHNPRTVMLSATQVYTLTTKDTINNCSSTDNIDVIIIGGPTTVLAVGTPTTICLGDTSHITTTVGGGDGTYVYSWTSNPAGYLSTAANIDVNPIITTTYTVNVLSNGSSASSSVIVTVNPLPNISFSGLSSTACSADASMTLSGSPFGGIFTGTGVNQVAGVYSFNPAIAGSGSWNVVYNYTDVATNCSNADTQLVLVNPNPIVNAGNDVVIVTGNTTTLSGSASGAGNYKYAWTPTSLVVNSNQASTQTVALTSSQIFDLQVTDTLTTCSANDDVLITVSNPNVPVSISANVTPATVCDGDTAFITSIATDGTGIYTYSWTSVPVGFTSSLQNPKVTPGLTTVYTVVVNDGVTTSSAAVTVNVKVSPAVALYGLDTSNCNNGIKDTLQGFPSGGFFTGAGMSANIFDPVVAGIGYHVIEYSYTASNGCSASIKDTTHVYGAPIANAGTDYIINTPPSQSATLSGSASGGSSNYNYSWSPANLFANANQQSVTTANFLLFTTQFTLEVVDQVSTCSSSDDIVVTVIGGPITVNPVASPDTICAGDQVQLNAFAGGGLGTYMYAWTSVPSGFIDLTANPVVSPAVTTTYTISVFDGVNTASNSVVVEVGAIPNVSITSALTPYCDNGVSEVLTAMPTGGVFYGNGISGNTFSPSTAGNGSHQIIYEYQSSLGCVNSDTVYAMVQSAPIADAGSDISIACNGAGGLIGSNPIANKTYLWNPSNGLTQPTFSNTIANPSSTTIYTVEVTDTITTCSNTDQVTVTVTGGPSLSLSNDTIICNGEAVTLMATGSATGYQWSNGQTNGSITVAPLLTTVYTVTASDASTCTTVDSVKVSVNVPYVFLGPDISVNDTNSVVLDAGFGYVNYDWNTGDNDQAIVVQAYVNAQLGLNKYLVEVTDVYGCKAKDSVMITYMLGLTTNYDSKGFNVYPNPSKGKFIVEIEADIPADYLLEIVNLQGKIIYSNTVKAKNTMYSTILDVSTLAKGVYLIRLSNNDYLSTKKLIIN